MARIKRSRKTHNSWYNIALLSFVRCVCVCMLFLRLLWLLLCVVAVMLVPRLLLCFHLVWIEFDVRCGVRARTRHTEKECMWIYHVHIFDIEYVNWLNTFMIWIYICNKICSLWTDCIESNLRFIPFIMFFSSFHVFVCVCFATLLL